jgi:hypothetical protein
VESPQEFEQFFILDSREASPDAHVCRDILVVRERALGESAGVMALVAIHRKHLAASERVFIALVIWTRPWNAPRGGALRKVDRRVLTAKREKADE